jgi:hyperosmotically inducible periplasmic protein
MGDAGITTAVKTKLLADTVVGGLDINVDTKDAIVTLTGDVASSAEKRKAVQIARDTDNVKSVKDNLKIVKK